MTLCGVTIMKAKDMKKANEAIGAPGWRPTKVHPEAAEFPIMPSDVEALAEDIRAGGLIDPITVDAEGMLVDGRTRLAACELAGIEPRFAVLNGEDVVRFIWSRNRKRRQMTQGQFAMVGAMGSGSAALTPSGAKGGRAATTGVVEAARKASVAKATMAKAFLVRDYCQDLVEGVKMGHPTLDAAFAEAEKRKRERDWRENGIEQLRKIAPDLAARVTDGEITVDEGRKLHEKQLADERDQRESVLLGLANVTMHAGSFVNAPTLLQLPDWLIDETAARDFARYYPKGIDELREKMKAARAGIEAIEAVLETVPTSKKGRTK